MTGALLLSAVLFAAVPFERTEDFAPVVSGPRQRASERTRLYAEFQIKYGLYHNYLWRRTDRPLFFDRSLRPADNRFTYETPASYLVNVREARRMGLDGFNLITLRSRFREFVAFDRWSREAGVTDFANLFTVGYGENSQKSASAELFGMTIEAALKDPLAPRLRGKPLIATYNYRMYTPDEHRAFIAGLEERFGKDSFVLCGDLSGALLARLRRSYDANGRLSAAEIAALEAAIREVLDVAGGVQLSVPQYYSRPDGAYPRRSDFRLFDAYIAPALETVFALPQYRSKAFGFYVRQGYVNYKNGDHDDEACTATLRNELRRVARLNPDYLLFFEWNEVDENTMFQPTVTGGGTVGRILRYHSRVLNGLKPDPYPGDDVTVPPLALTSRSTVKLGEELHFEILNVPDGVFAQEMKVRLSVVGLDGRPIADFPEESIAADRFGAVDYKVSTAGLRGGDVLVPTLTVNGRRFEGFVPVRVEPTVSWNYKTIRQSLRDLPKAENVRAAVKRRGDGRYAFGLAGDFGEPLASVELLADGQELTACGLEKEYDFTSNVIVRLAFTVPGKGAGGRGLKVRVKGAEGCRFSPEYAPNVDAGRPAVTKDGCGYGVDVWFWTEEVGHFIQIPRAFAETAVVEIKSSKGERTVEIPVKTLLVRDRASAILEDATSFRVDASRVLRLPDLPPHLGVPSVDWRGFAETRLSHPVFHFRVITEAGHVWRSPPFRPDEIEHGDVTLDVYDEFAHRRAKAVAPAALVPDLDYAFDPTAGATLACGDPRFDGQLGGGTVFGETYFAEVYPGSGIRVAPGTRAPMWVRDDGDWCLRFDGTNDYVNLPIEAFPHAAFTLTMDVKPQVETNAPMVLFRHFAWTRGSLSLFIRDGRLVATWGDKDLKRTPVFETGLAVKSGVWQTVSVSWDFEAFVFSVDGRTKRVPWTGRAWGMRPSAFGGHDKNELGPGGGKPVYFKGLLRRLRIRHAASSPSPVGRTFDVRDFGAVGDGVTKDTRALQDAIDAAAKAGGGRVSVPAGRYLTGSLFLKSNVTFDIDAGAVVEASRDPADYNAADVCPQNWASEAENTSGGHLFLSIMQTNVVLCGAGRIDGNGVYFMTNGFDKARIGKRTGKNGLGGLNRQDAILWRPGQMVYFVESKGVTLRGLEIANAPYWTVFVHGCEDVTAENLRIRSSRPPETETYNGDGLNLDCCRHVRVTGCDIRTSDDALCLRADGRRLLHAPAETSDVIVRNCRLSSLQDAIRIGVGEGVVRDCLFDGLEIDDTVRGINFSSTWFPSRGVDFRDIVISNVTARTTSSFLRIHRLKSADSDIRSIRLANVTGTQGKPSYIWSRKGKPFEDIVLENVNLDRGIEVVNVNGFRLTGGTLEEIRLSSEEYERRSADIESFRKMLY